MKNPKLNNPAPLVSSVLAFTLSSAVAIAAVTIMVASLPALIVYYSVAGDKRVKKRV